MAAVGNLNDYVKYQMAQGHGAAGGGGPAGMATELAVGFSIAQQIMQQTGVAGAAPAGPAGQAGPAGPAGQAVSLVCGSGGPELLSPADVAKALGVPETDVMAIIESGELAAKKIGASYRVTRAALDKYLAS